MKIAELEHRLNVLGLYVDAAEDKGPQVVLQLPTDGTDLPQAHGRGRVVLEIYDGDVAAAALQAGQSEQDSVRAGVAAHLKEQEKNGTRK